MAIKINWGIIKGMPLKQKSFASSVFSRLSICFRTGALTVTNASFLPQSPLCLAPHLRCLLSPVTHVCCPGSRWGAWNWLSMSIFLLASVFSHYHWQGVALWFGSWMASKFFMPTDFRDCFWKSLFYFVPLNQSKRSVPSERSPTKQDALELKKQRVSREGQGRLWWSRPGSCGGQRSS